MLFSLAQDMNCVWRENGHKCIFEVMSMGEDRFFMEKICAVLDSQFFMHHYCHFISLLSEWFDRDLLRHDSVHVQLTYWCILNFCRSYRSWIQTCFLLLL